jgi:LysM repeat protein
MRFQNLTRARRVFAQHNGVSIGALRAANDIPDVDLIHAGQVLTIPRALVASSAEPAISPATDSVRIQGLRDGLERGWVVTRNPNGDAHRLFVHKSVVGGALTDLRYLIEESADGSTWTVYLPRLAVDASQFGRKVGVIPKPPNVDIGYCNCM